MQNTILIVEDDLPVSNALLDKLTREGFQVLQAMDGEAGLEVALQKHPDLILLDIVMPKMDGLTMLKKLREESWGKEAKIIMLTNLNEVEMVSEAVEQGSYNYLVKSDWKIEDVVVKIKEMLKK